MQRDTLHTVLQLHTAAAQLKGALRELCGTGCWGDSIRRMARRIYIPRWSMAAKILGTGGDVARGLFMRMVTIT